MWILSLTMPNAYNVPPRTVAPVAGGVTFSDSKNIYIPTGTQVQKYIMSTTIARERILSNSALSVAGDGAREVNEPIAKAKFYHGSYWFRPDRSAENAIAKVMHLINCNKMHYAVDIDIKGFFDNIDHGKLLKQMWTLGIRDKKLLKLPWL